MLTNKYKKHIYRFTLGAIIAVLIPLLVISANVSATMMDDIIEKALASSLIECYNWDFKDPLTIEEYKQYYNTAAAFIGGKDKVPLPNTYFSSDSMKCTKYVEFLMGQKGIVLPSKRNVSEIADFLRNLGYVEVNDGFSGQCVYFNYTIISGANGVLPERSYLSPTQQICASEINSDGTIAVDNVEILSGDTSAVQFQDAKRSSITLDCSWMFWNTGGCSKHTFTKNVTLWSDFINGIRDDLLVNNLSGNGFNFGYSYLLDASNPMEILPYGDASNEFELNSGSIKKGTEFLLGKAYSEKPTFSDEEEFVLYQNYLRNFYGADIICNPSETELTAMTSMSYQNVRIYDSGEFKNCYARALKNENKSINGIDALSRRFIDENCNFACVCRRLNNSTITSLPDDSAIVDPGDHEYGEAGPGTGGSGGGGSGSGSGGGSSGEVTNSELCENAGIKGVSWVLCPAMSNMEGTATFLDELVQNWLSVDTQFYDSESGAADVWQYMRDIANVLLIIILLVIVFSQVTGFGIDNYGIKKMLPKLVVMAIVLNLSFVLCQVLIDLSNIFGSGLNSMFSGIGTTIMNSRGLTPEDFSISSTIATIFGIFGVTGAAAPTAVMIAGAAASPVAAVILIILALITIIVAVLVFFLMLGARMIIIVLCMSIAPVAFACYILPNTQGLFKKWWNLFKAALLIFPICGAIGGMSNIIKVIAYGGGSENFWMLIVAMFVPFLPFFMLPSLLKGSITALGAAGAALTTLGNGLRSGARDAKRAVEGTERFKDWSQYQQNQAAVRRAQLVHDSLSGRTDLTARERDRLLRADRTLIGDAQRRADAEINTSGVALEAAMIGQRKKVERDTTQDYMTLINEQTRNGEDEDALFRMYNQYVAGGDKSGAVAVARIAGRRKDTAARFLNEQLASSEAARRIGGYNDAQRNILRSVAKEVSTGENSGAYRESSPLGFEFAAQVNRNADSNVNYSSWLGQNEDGTAGSGNIHNAIDRHVATSQQLVGIRNGVLDEIAGLMDSGAMDAADATRLRNLALRTINDRSTSGIWDTTKAENIYRIAGLEYDPTNDKAMGSSDGSVRDGQLDSGIIQVSGVHGTPKDKLGPY